MSENGQEAAGATVLVGHDSEATAYVVADYPYGFRLRCQIRYWVETKVGYGQRLCSQTSNPKREGLVWNKPKKGTYSSVVVMTLDAVGHVSCAVLSQSSQDESKIDSFVASYAPALESEYHARQIKLCRALARAAKKIVWTVRTAEPGEIGQTRAEQREILTHAVNVETRAMAREGSAS